MSGSRDAALARIRSTGLVPIVRAASADDAWRVAEAILSTGIGIVEITMNTPNAARAMEKIAGRYGDEVVLGAGTVLDTDTCRAALGAGARFIVTPAVDREVIDAARGADMVCIPGALTPTEILSAWRAGADIVKVFPCGAAGGPRYIRSLRGPFADIPFLPTGGISLEVLADYFRAGATAVGLGSELFDADTVRRGDFDAIRANLRGALATIKTARLDLGS